jgi:CheY-like chemotaxis protein
MMGGRIWLDSEPGHGSSFIFTARLGLDDQAGTGEGQKLGPGEQSALGQQAGSLPGLNILLAEDNQINQKLATILLQRRGHRVTLAENGHQALDALARESYDLVLMDVEMPEMDGVRATALIRQQEGRQGGRVPIIALTAHALKGDRERFLAAGMDDYLTKPLDAGRLFQVVEAWGRRPRPQDPSPSPSGAWSSRRA